MVDGSYHVYVIQGQTERDWSDCQAALAHVPARLTALPFSGDPDALIARTRDADALVVAFSPITRGVMSALEGLKTVVRTGVGYDVIDVPAASELGVERVSLEALAERSDYVSVHTLLNAETRHMIGEKFFARMKPTALLINTSRGPVVDEQALARALRDKRLAGAALDVWETEPAAADNPLLHMDNVIATPHAAYSRQPPSPRCRAAAARRSRAC